MRGIRQLFQPVSAQARLFAISVTLSPLFSFDPTWIQLDTDGPQIGDGTSCPASSLTNACVHFFYNSDVYAHPEKYPQLFNPAGPSPTHKMTYHGGSIMLTHKAYLIFWTGGHSFASTYMSLIERWFTDVGSTSMYNINHQYYQCTLPTCSPKTYIQNTESLGGYFLDTVHPYPSGRPGTASAPLLNADIYNEAYNAILYKGWPLGGLNVEFYVFTPKGVESCFDSSHSGCTIGAGAHFGTESSSYCAYHSWFYVSPHYFIYANMSYAATWKTGYTYNCGTHSTTVNGNPDADIEISPTSHEQFESVTDPLINAWYDSNGAGEIGDKCAYRYGTIAPNGSNVYLHLHYYIIQQEWSNAAFIGIAYSGCRLSYP
jgi:hypothetical protein